jgi:hypothetical protein
MSDIRAGSARPDLLAAVTAQHARGWQIRQRFSNPDCGVRLADLTRMRGDGPASVSIPSPWNSVEDVWRTLSDVPVRPASDYRTPIESGVNLAAVARVRRGATVIAVRESVGAVKTLTPVPISKPDPWEHGADRKLWRMAGTLMVAAMCVLGVLAWLTFVPAGARTNLAAALASEAHVPSPSLPETPVHHAPSTPAISAAAPVLASATKDSSRKHKHKSHKRARYAKRR